MGDNIACVIVGSKQFILYPPEDHANLYYTPVHPNRKSWLKQPDYLTWSLVDMVGRIERADLDTFPLFERIKDLSVQTQVNSGECIFIPAGWGHKVYTRTPTLMIQYWRMKKPKSLNGTFSIFFNRNGDLINPRGQTTLYM